MTSLDLHGFAAIVREMRALQTMYFRTKSSDILFKAKQAERKVDEALAQMQTGPDLFDVAEGTADQ